MNYKLHPTLTRPSWTKLFLMTCMVSKFAQAEAPVSPEAVGKPSIMKEGTKESMSEDAAFVLSESEDEDIYELKEFVVVGQRLANRRAIQERLANDALVDAIGGNELGQIPDLNLGEALGRLPGVTTVQDEGVGRYVSIRGLRPEFVNVTQDGAEISSAVRTFDADAARGTNLQSIPIESLSKVQVFKTVTPDMDGASIAGTINLETRSAFDQPGVAVNSQWAMGQIFNGDGPDYDDKLSYKGYIGASATLGEREQFGLLIDASYREINRLYSKIGTLGYDQARLGTEDALLPNFAENSYTDEKAVKESFFTKFEFRPYETIHTYLSLNWFNEKEILGVNDHGLFESGVYDRVDSTFSEFSGIASHRAIETGSDNAHTITAGADMEIRDWGLFEVLGNFSTSEFFLDETRAQWLSSWRGLDGAFVQSGRDFDFFLDDASLEKFKDPESYALNDVRFNSINMKKELATLKVDWGDNNSGDDFGWGYKLGGKFKRQEVTNRESSFRFQRPAFDPTSFNDGLFLDGFQAPTVNSEFIVTSVDSLAAASKAAGGPEAFSGDFDRIRVFQTNALDYNAEEDVLAGYLLGRYATERFSTVFGFRYEASDFTGESRFEQENDGRFVESKVSYGNFLPSTNFKFKILEDLVLRGAYSRTIGRPELDDLIPRESALFGNAVDGYALQRSNPSLEPRIADSFDLGLEYYFDSGNSILSFGVFRKQIEDEIFILNSTEEFIIGGVLEPVRVIQPQNAGSAEVSGMEVALYVDSLTFLPSALHGLGFSANYTYLDGESELPDADGNVVRTINLLQNQSEHAFNMTVFYAHERFSLRMAGRYTSKNIIEINTDPLLDQFEDDYLQFDFKAQVDIWSGASAFIEVRNLTDELFYNFGGRFDESVVSGRTVWLGLNVNL